MRYILLFVWVSALHQMYAIRNPAVYRRYVRQNKEIALLYVTYAVTVSGIYSWQHHTHKRKQQKIQEMLQQSREHTHLPKKE